MYKKITLLIGNGFDKSCDLKSAYTDMYEGYISSESKSPTIEKFKEELDTDITTWADFEMAMCSYMKSFSNEKEFLECLHDFRDYLTGHLEAEEAKFEKKLGRRLLKKCQEEIRDSFRTIQNYAFPEGERYTTVFSAICFNYTKVADMVFNSYNLNVAKIVHVHGTLDDSPVMGINDPAQFGADIPYPITADIITEYVKPSFNREYDRKR
ncbi:MAG: hypothetical protein J6P98_01685, partial [Clostridia bacterium]|nr:hypothetical protein [Clostridia bacterium]